MSANNIGQRNPKHQRTLARMKAGLPIGAEHGDTYGEKTMERRKKMDERLVEAQGDWKEPCKSCADAGEADCLVAPYKDQKDKCNGQIHHIVHDSVYRLGKRGSPDRIPGAPSEADGMCICLHDDTHSKLHAKYNKKLHDLKPKKGKNGKAAPAGTAPMKDIFEVMEESIKDIKDVPPDQKCKDLAVRKAEQQMERSGMHEHHGRTSKDPIPPPRPAYRFLKDKL